MAQPDERIATDRPDFVESADVVGTVGGYWFLNPFSLNAWADKKALVSVHKSKSSLTQENP